MVAYTVRDISMSFSGDLNIGSNGDIKLADSYETHKSAVNFLIRTDKGQFKPDKRIGCDLGTFVGDHMQPETFNAMEQTSLENITKFVLNPSDIQIHVMPLSENNAGVFVVVGGSYLDSDGKLLVTSPEVLTYTYPYSEGHPTLINIS